MSFMGTTLVSYATPGIIPVSMYASTDLTRSSSIPLPHLRGSAGRGCSTSAPILTFPRKRGKGWFRGGVRLGPDKQLIRRAGFFAPRKKFPEKIRDNVPQQCQYVQFTCRRRRERTRLLRIAARGVRAVGEIFAELFQDLIGHLIDHASAEAGELAG